MRNMIPIHDVLENTLDRDAVEERRGGAHVVPISLPGLDSCSLKAEGAFPSTGLGGVFRQWKLTGVIIPRTKKVNGLDVSRGTKSETKLNGSHYVVRVL